ncbi:hypothetical protein BDR04DRAFT_81507 [Suillus decipiens]|nr:hypothetical protein BDR04DRAFT_81507 [Suillus decipiens]
MHYIVCCWQVLAAWMAMKFITDMCTWTGRVWRQLTGLMFPMSRPCRGLFTVQFWPRLLERTALIIFMQAGCSPFFFFFFFCKEQPRCKSGFNNNNI